MEVFKGISPRLYAFSHCLSSHNFSYHYLYTGVIGKDQHEFVLRSQDVRDDILGVADFPLFSVPTPGYLSSKTKRNTNARGLSREGGSWARAAEID